MDVSLISIFQKDPVSKVFKPRKGLANAALQMQKDAVLTRNVQTPFMPVSLTRALREDPAMLVTFGDFLKQRPPPARPRNTAVKLMVISIIA